MAKHGILLLSARRFSLLIAVVALTNVAVLLNIPVLRQIFGVIFLTFIPGLLIVSALKLTKLGLTEKIVLMVGLSIAFSMLFSLFVNSSFLALGYTKPLSTINLLVFFDIAALILIIMTLIRKESIAIFFNDFKLTQREKILLIIPLFFPFLSIIGTHILNLADNNLILIFLLLMIPAYIIFISISNSRVPEKVYPAAIFLISISLLLMYSLRSNHILGGDIHQEYYMYLTILDNMHWKKLGFENLEAALSSSLLPAVYQTFVKMDPEYLYKLIFSLMVSFLPLVIYILSKKYVGSLYAFLASVLLMSQVIFLWTPSATRINVAIFFFALMLMSIFTNGISDMSRKALIIIFIASIIISHYGVTYISFFLLSFAWFGMQILSRVVSWGKKLATLNVNPLPGKILPNITAMVNKIIPTESAQTHHKSGIDMALVALFMVMLFFWYSLAVGPTFDHGVRFVYGSITSMEWFLGKEAGLEQPIQAALGKSPEATMIHQKIEFVVSWLMVIFIIVGVLTTLIRFKTMVSFRESGYKKFEAEYFILSLECIFILVISTVIPYISRFYGMGRTFFQTTVLLSVFFVIGGIEIAKYIKIGKYFKSRPYWVILVVLIPYFLSTTGVVSQLSGFPRAITLNSRGPLYDIMYISDSDSYSAKWLREHAAEGIKIYATGLTRDVLLSQSKMSAYIIGSRIFLFRVRGEMDGYIYLRYVDLEKYSKQFAGKDRIYANTRAEIYR